MSEAAKSARAAMKEKASRLAKGDPKKKVDASSWTPPEPLDADVKTGLRPISRRAFKKGGKVVGEMAEHHAGRMPRAFANAKVNRDVKDANEERKGKKHVGGFKRGGKPRDYDMDVQGAGDVTEEPVRQPVNPPLPPRRPVEDADADSTMQTETTDNDYRRQLEGAGRKRGGRTKKADGGLMDPRAAAAARMAQANSVAGVPSAVMNFGGIRKGALSPLRGMKKGGEAGFEGSKKDVREDKKLAKKHGMTMKEWERSKMDEKHDRQRSMKGLKSGGECVSDGELQGTRPTGGRKARKDGGRTGKARTNINIVIAQKPDQTGQGMPGGMGAPPPIAPIPMPAPAPASPAGMPVGAPAGLPAPVGGLPMARKSGGRTYPKMHYGAGSGLGRLEKIEEYGISQR